MKVTLLPAQQAPVIDLAAPLGPQKAGIYLVHIDEWCPPNDGNDGYLAKCSVSRGMLDFNAEGEWFFNTEYVGQSVWIYVNPPTATDKDKFKRQLGAFKASLLAMSFSEDFVHGGGTIDLDDPTEGGTLPTNAIVGRTMCVLYEPPLNGYVRLGSDGKNYACKQRVLPVIPRRYMAFREGEKPQYQNRKDNPQVSLASDAAGGGGFGGGAKGFGKSNGSGGAGFDPNAGSEAGSEAGGNTQPKPEAKKEVVADPWGA